MKTKLHTGLLLLLLVLFVKQVDKNSLSRPNQQILVEFTNATVDESTVKATITSIQRKLQVFEIQNFKIEYLPNAGVKIIYFSSKDIKAVEALLSVGQGQAILSEVKQLKGELHHRSKNNYKLNVAELKKSSKELDNDINAVEIVEYNSKTDRFNHLKKLPLAPTVNGDYTKWTIYRSQYRKKRRLLVHSCSYKIPEVRAGPLV